MSINWNNIRPLGSSKQDGFEELICQLARREKIPDQNRFVRIGKPDGGKECFWELKNGNQHLWQAKYFTSATAIGSSQWAQINDSVITAIDNHPKLVKYYVALPIDRPDASVKGKTSLLQKWNDKVKEWQTYAATKGMSVVFEYWGSSELVDRLSYTSNIGMRHFWFDEEAYTDEWYRYKNDTSIMALGARYTPELNQELPIANLFNGLSRNDNFVHQSHEWYKQLLEKYRGLYINIPDAALQCRQTALEQEIVKYKSLYEAITLTGNNSIPVEQLIEQLDAIRKNAAAVSEKIRELGAALDKKEKKTDPYDRTYRNELGSLNGFTRFIHEVKTSFQSHIFTLASYPYLLITGNAGVGKSHLLADIVKRRTSEGRKSILLLGEDFTNQALPWTQILSNQLRVSSRDEHVFLGALNAQAESENNRIILFIDALNEGEGVYIWPSRLKAFIASVKLYPWIGLVVTLRSTYEELLAPVKELDASFITREEHEGFEGIEYEANKLFFGHYGITQPGSPLLHPEFGNPLFLKLFCLGLQNQGKHEVPPGYEGITTIINEFIKNIDYKLSRPNKLYYDYHKQLVKKAVHAIVQYMIDKDVTCVPYEEADTIVETLFHSACTHKEPFLKRLVSEGIFNKDISYDGAGSNPVYVISLAYQRFQDHMYLANLLDRHLDLDNPFQSFATGPLHELVKDNITCQYNQNLVEALAIQIPERVGKELFEVAPYTKDFYTIPDAFIESLIWRKPGTIGEGAKKYIDEVITTGSDQYDLFLDAIIPAGMKPEFLFNAEYLHQILFPLPLAKRDAGWTIWLQDKYGEEATLNGVKRMIDWAWSKEDRSHVSDESMMLACTSLTWFLTSSNRLLRDAATKGLVSLLQNRTQLITPLLQKFEEVNDPYVMERSYGVAYGSVLRTTQTAHLADISIYIYENVFSQKEVYPHVLLREYARGIIEYTLHKEIALKIDVVKIRPPYNSKPIPKRLPSNAVIDKKYGPKGKTGHYGKSHWGAGAIIDSMTTEAGRNTSMYGDFGRYTFQYGFGDLPVNAALLSNYAIQRIWELGYDPLVFSTFDSEQKSGRETGAKERIGKKYQWIVYHELLARVADESAKSDTLNNDDEAESYYDDPWRTSARDIDPTLLIKETGAERFGNIQTSHWWYKSAYAPWSKSHDEWMKDQTDVPKAEQIIEVVDEKGAEWLWLEVHPEWQEPHPLGEDPYERPRKRLQYFIKSYLVKKEDLKKLQTTFSRSFDSGDLPRDSQLMNVFEREYYWAPSFEEKAGEPSKRNAFKTVYDKQSSREIGEVALTTELFHWEEEFDFSKTEPITFYKTSSLLYEGLGLVPSLEGVFTDTAGEVICFDPSVHRKSLSGLLVRKRELQQWLDKEGLAIFWTVIGQKQMLGEYRSKGPYYGRLNVSGLYRYKEDGLSGELKTKKE